MITAGILLDALNNGDDMKDIQILAQYTKRPRGTSSAWASALWEDFYELDTDEEEPPFDAEFDDLARGSK